MNARPTQFTAGFTTGYQQALSDALDAIAQEVNLPIPRLVAALRFIADNSTDSGTRTAARHMEGAESMAVSIAALDALEAGK